MKNNLPVYLTDAELKALNKFVGDGNRSAFVVQAIRETITRAGKKFPGEMIDRIEIHDGMTPKQAEYAKLRNDGMTYQQIADKYGVTRQAVSDALKGYK